MSKHNHPTDCDCIECRSVAVFTDDDLQRLKQGKSHITHIGVDTPLFQALLARLETSEYAFMILHEHVSGKFDKGWDKKYVKAHQAWRKAAGKDKS